MTVIIATYNWSAVLPFSIASVQRQTFTDWELLVIGDGCTDDSADVVERTRAGDDRIRWRNLPRNSGHQSGPNNEGIRQARGDVIAYLGHDDLWLPHHLDVMVRALDDAAADIAYGLVELIDRPGALPRCVPSDGRGPKPWAWHPPTGLIHRREPAVAAGGWRRQAEVSVAPETELLARLRAAGATDVFVPRLVAVKFPASLRQDSYRLRLSSEQTAWTRRIVAETDFEQRELVMIAAHRQLPLMMQARRVIRHRVKSIVFGTMRGRPPSRWERWFVTRSHRRQRLFRGLSPLPSDDVPRATATQ